MPPPVFALLGPTNTGKTYLAIEKMLEHRTGMIGFPLRLLARENYDRIVRVKGEGAVALVTGEERILPKGASYYVCTVEAMPLDRAVDFLAVDEIQLAADRERGHVFTDRLLHARGHQQTMLLGADTIRPLLSRLVPEAVVLSRPRLSTLRYAPPRKLTRLPRRAAVIVFSVAELYATAERLRRETGGVALVFGGLSPRTRNAQVGLYQAGDVDFLVATDAIGMGLNLDIDHVVFTSLRKFDGRGPRTLRPGEVAQIAGRAGRYLRDGTFGPTAELGAFAPELVSAVEEHRFEPLESLFWRNTDLSFASIRALLDSLARRPSLPSLVRMRHADDHRALEALAADSAVRERVRGAAGVRLLWDVCQIPDFSNVLTDAHTRLLAQIHGHLAAGGVLPEDWVAAQVAAIDRTDGDVDTLLYRIAAIRTWTYVSHRPAWLGDPGHWQERTRAVEDELSDALHERLTEQFVDRRAAVIARHDADGLVAEVDEAGEVLVQGLRAGRLEGFRFVPDAGAREGARNLIAAANRALRAGADDRVRRCVEEPDQAFTLEEDGSLKWRGWPVARLVAGDGLLTPRVDVFGTELLDPMGRERVRRRLAGFVERLLRQRLAPLFALRDAPLTGTARGMAFALVEGGGALARRAIAGQVRALTGQDRRALSRAGVTVGRLALFLPALFRSSSERLRLRLWGLRRGESPPELRLGPPSLPRRPEVSTDAYLAAGYQGMGPLAVRVDRLDRLTAMLDQASRSGPFPAPEEAEGLLGAPPADVRRVILALGYAAEGPELYRRRAPRPERQRAAR